MCARTICSTASRPVSSNSWRARRACADSFIKRDTSPFASIFGDYSLFFRTTGKEQTQCNTVFGPVQKILLYDVNPGGAHEPHAPTGPALHLHPSLKAV